MSEAILTDPRLDALRSRLEGTRQAAPGTIIMALNVGSRFLAWSGKDAPTPEDVDHYFAYRRGAGSHVMSSTHAVVFFRYHL